MPMGSIEYVDATQNYHKQYYEYRKEAILNVNRNYYEQNKEDINRKRRERYHLMKMKRIINDEST